LNDTLLGQAFEETFEAVAAGFALLVVAHYPKDVVLYDGRDRSEFRWTNIL
jgi:hypothetical protein